MEPADVTLAVESDWLPAAELHRLIGAHRADFPQLTVVQEDSLGHRGLDPTIAVALITGAFTLLAPFVAKLAERLFRAEPDASVTLTKPDGTDHATLLASLPEDVRNQLINEAIAAGALRVRLSIEPPAR